MPQLRCIGNVIPMMDYPPATALNEKTPEIKTVPDTVFISGDRVRHNHRYIDIKTDIERY